MRKNRSVDVEPVFGHIKYNRIFKRLTLKGIPKINIELGLLAIAHNLKKMIRLTKNNQNNANFPNSVIKLLKKLISIIYDTITHDMKSSVRIFKSTLTYHFIAYCKFY